MGVSMTIGANPPDPAAREIIRVGRDLLHGSAAMFYWVDDRLQLGLDVELDGIPPSYPTRYLADLTHLDPLHVQKMAVRHQRVAVLYRAERQATRDIRPYNMFLEDHGVRDLIELVFWSDGMVVAGLSVMRGPDDPLFETSELQEALALQRFVEFTIQNHARVNRLRLHRCLLTLQLTTREIQVAELAAQGATNDQIAQLLGVTLPTVKTHLLHVLDKTGHANRTELAAAFAGRGHPSYAMNRLPS